MNITDIRIRKILTDGRLRAVVSITIDNMIAIHDIKVIEGIDRLFVAMPSRKEENGTFRDIVHPISGDARRMFEEAILNAYKEQLEINAEQHIAKIDTVEAEAVVNEAAPETETQPEE